MSEDKLKRIREVWNDYHDNKSDYNSLGLLNLTSWMGERMGLVIQEYDTLLAELKQEHDEANKLMDERDNLLLKHEATLANYERLQAERDLLRQQLDTTKDALETAIDVIEMDDARLVQLGDPTELVHSDDHNRFIKEVRELITKLGEKK